MRTGPEKGFLVGFGVLLVLLVSLVIGFREPSAQGKALTYWLEQINKGNQVEKSLAAIQSIGPRCLPELSRQIEWKEPWLHKRIRLFLDTHKLLNLNLKLREPVDLRMASIYALAPFGKSANPLLSKIDFNQPVPLEVVFALGHLGITSEEALIRACSSTNRNIRIQAAFVLGKIEFEHGPPGFWQWSHDALGYGMGYGYQIDHPDAIIEILRKHPNDAVRKAGEEWTTNWKQFQMKSMADMEATEKAFQEAAQRRRDVEEKASP